ncbi:MAG TPA: helix-turn-helix domain-containing protein [Chthonomonadaceae bacterium]|nr:helix-turn-helix domain-containing protein [Chthonomonadaceae bacterium]
MKHPKSRGHAKADALIHPIRLRILMALAGTKLTPQQIAVRLPDVAQASLYRHISILANENIVTVVEEYPVRGAVEKVYAISQENALLTAEEMANFTHEDHLHYFTAFLGTLVGQFRAYLQQETINLKVDGASYNSTALNLTDEELQQFKEQIMTLLKTNLKNEATPERRRHSIAMIMIPEKRDP